MNINTKYSREDLNKLHLDTFKGIASQHPKNECVGGNWFVSVGRNTILVTPYSIKQGDGSWKDFEYCTTL